MREQHKPMWIDDVVSNFAPTRIDDFLKRISIEFQETHLRIFRLDVDPLL